MGASGGVKLGDIIGFLSEGKTAGSAKGKIALHRLLNGAA